MFAHFLLFVTIIFAFGSVVWQNIPYHSLVKDDILYAYDYIIVGGGTAGSVMASRLSEVEGITVLLLEAGEEPNSKNVLEIPAMSSEHQRTFMDWSYKVEPQRHACQSFDNKQIYWPRGKMLGGSDSFGHLVYVRGNPRDFDEWAVNGCKGWSYEDVLPYFIKSENNKNAYYKQSDYHGDAGPLPVSDMMATQVAEKFVGAAKELKFDRLDINGPNQLGVGLLQGTTSWGRRHGVIHSFLHPSMGRDNLHVATKALVHKVLFKGDQATGVELSWNQTIRRVRARKEVILCAGTIETPHILMLSGVGPRRHLESFGIPVVSDLPVGQNLQDHVSILGLEFTIISKIATTEKKSKSLWTLFDYLLFGRGVLTSSGYEAAGFFPGERHSPSIGRPSVQLTLFNSLLGSVMSEDRLRTLKSRTNLNYKVFNALFGDMMYEEGFTIYPVLLHPLSRGTITLNSTVPTDTPIIDPRYLENPEDVKTLLEGIRLVEKLIATKEMASIGASPTNRKHPNCERHLRFSDEYWSCFIEQNTISMNHAVGTCKMGAAGDTTTVVDPLLRVKGVKRLRVVDASVLPDLPSGNINAVVVMTAERAADLILDRVSVRKFGEKESHEEWHERIHKKDEL